MFWLFKHLLLIRKALRANDTPHQLALGAALGMLLGLLPKGNLLAIACTIGLFSTRLNLGVAMMTALAFSIVGPFLDLLTHRLGLTMLGSPTIRPVADWLYDRPLVPWTRFNNTVVAGSLVTGLAAFLPVYGAARFWFGHRAERLAAAQPDGEASVEDPVEEDGATSTVEVEPTGEKMPTEEDRDELPVGQDQPVHIDSSHDQPQAPRLPPMTPASLTSNHATNDASSPGSSSLQG